MAVGGHSLILSRSRKIEDNSWDEFKKKKINLLFYNDVSEFFVLHYNVVGKRTENFWLRILTIC